MASGVAKIYCINADGTNNRLIFEAPFGLSHQDWSPDTMMFAAVGYVGGNSTWSIYKFNSNGYNLVRLTFVNNVWDSEPVWSSDMSKISFTRIYPNQNMKRELWIMNSDGGGQHYIGIEGFSSKWSKDGTKFVYTSKKTNNNFDIYICDTNGTNEIRLTDTPLDESFPIYSKDGTEIAYTAGTGSSMTDWEIYKMKSDGSGNRKLTDNSAYDSYPRWSPDGTMFAFISDIHQTGKYEVYVMDTSGSNMQRVTFSPANFTGVNPVWRPVVEPISIKKLGNRIPEGFKLYQNYPNPFNPSTTIKFSISMYPLSERGAGGFVTMKIFDLLGCEILTLLNQGLSPGTYEVEWDASDYPSGVYFYKLSVWDYNETRKMVLIK